MSKRTIVLGSLVGVVGLTLAVLGAVAGCQKEKPVAQTRAEPAVQKAVATEQTICPVMGNPIDKNIFVEYQGKKVYFCCQGCPAVFQADPQKYLAKLPQFTK